MSDSTPADSAVADAVNADDDITTEFPTEGLDAPFEGSDADTFRYPVTVEEAGAAAKRVTVRIPRERIRERLETQFAEVHAAVALPGFRPGRAPKPLVRRKFGDRIRADVAQTLVQESYRQALESNNLRPLGEPQFDENVSLDLPEDDDLSFSFRVEVQPDVELPDVAGLVVKKPKITITDDHVAQARKNLQEQQGALAPVEDRGVQDGDYLTADVAVTAEVDGTTIDLGRQEGAQLVARPGSLAGITVANLPQHLADLKPGETRTFTLIVPDDHVNEAARGREATVTLTLQDLKRLEPAIIDDLFLEQLGFGDQTELDEALREQMEIRVDQDIRQNMRLQVAQYLLEHVTIDLPEKLSARQTDRVVQRRAMTLMQRGMPQEQIRANIERLREGAGDEATRQLKLHFIFQKVAETHRLEVDEQEINGRIAQMAVMQDERPQDLKERMRKEGTLADLYLQMREQKAVDALIERVTVEEVDMDPKTLEDANTVAEAQVEGSVEGSPAAEVSTGVEGSPAAGPATDSDAT